MSDTLTHALVIGRRRPGRKIGRAVRETQQRLEAAGWKVEAEVVVRKRELRKMTAKALKSGVDVVVAVGGDGAVLQVVNVLAETDVALGIIPKGTGNLLAGNLGIPKPLEEAVKVILEGHVRRIDLGRVRIDGTDHYFSGGLRDRLRRPGHGEDRYRREAPGGQARLRRGGHARGAARP